MFISIDNFGFHAQLEHHVKMGIEVARKKKKWKPSGKGSFLHHQCNGIWQRKIEKILRSLLAQYSYLCTHEGPQTLN